jgi:hypothetical protein
MSQSESAGAPSHPRNGAEAVAAALESEFAPVLRSFGVGIGAGSDSAWQKAAEGVVRKLGELGYDITVR